MSGRRRYTSIDSAADRVGVSTRTIRRYISEGRLTGYRFGPRLIRLDVDEVECLIRPIPTARRDGGV